MVEDLFKELPEEEIYSHSYQGQAIHLIKGQHITLACKLLPNSIMGVGVEGCPIIRDFQHWRFGFLPFHVDFPAHLPLLSVVCNLATCCSAPSFLLLALTPPLLMWAQYIWQPFISRKAVHHQSLSDMLSASEVILGLHSFVFMYALYGVYTYSQNTMRGLSASRVHYGLFLWRIFFMAFLTINIYNFPSENCGGPQLWARSTGQDPIQHSDIIKQPSAPDKY